MALPGQLKSARMTDATVGVDIDDNVGDLEQVLCDIFGFTVDVNVTESPTNFDNSGRFTKALLRQKAAGPVGWRLLDSTSGKEFRLVMNDVNVLIDENTGTEAVPVWTNRATMVLGTGVWTFTGIPVGPAADPTTDNQLARKAYVDSKNDAQDTVIAGKVALAGDQNVGGIKTFTSIPVLPAADPTLDNEAARKAYVDSKVFDPSVAILQNRRAQNVGGGTYTTANVWQAFPLNVEYEDPDGIVDFSAPPVFTLQAGTYDIDARLHVGTQIGLGSLGLSQARLYRTTNTPEVQKNINNYDMYGQSQRGYDYGGHSGLQVLGRFTIAAQNSYQFELKAAVASGGDKGFGWPCNFAEEIYAQVKITKVA